MIIGSCRALNLSYSGCCELFLSPPCSINGCHCDQGCHYHGDCCHDIADIGCFPPSPTSPTPTPTNIPGKTKSKFMQYIMLSK